MSVVISANLTRLPNDSPRAVNDLHATEARWFAVRVGHRKEKVVARQLERVGVEYYLPLRDKPFNYASKTGVRRLPLLGGYIFVRIIAKETLIVKRLQFVFGFVKIGQEIHRVTEAEIDLLRRLSTDDSIAWVVEEKMESLEKGDLVEICRGPLAGVRGYYLHAKNKKTFVISFGGLDARLTTCEVSPDDVAPLDGPPQEVADDREDGKKKNW